MEQEENQTQDVVTILDDAPEENKTETKIAANDSQTPEDGIAELKSRLEDEKRMRMEAEARAHQAQQTATRAAAEVQDSNLQLINGAIDKLKRESDYSKARYRDALASGDYDTAAQIQESMSINAAKMLQLQNGKVSLEERLKNPPAETQQASDPIEQIASQLSPRSAAWIRANPDVVRDKQRYDSMVRAHNHAIGEGYVPDSDAYFQHIEMRLGMRNPPKQAEDEGVDVNLSAASAPTQKRTSIPAAPTTRTASGTGNKQNVVRLTSEMREMASMMGMSPEDYAKNMVALRKEGKLN